MVRVAEAKAASMRAISSSGMISIGMSGVEQVRVVVSWVEGESVGDSVMMMMMVLSRDRVLRAVTVGNATNRRRNELMGLDSGLGLLFKKESHNFHTNVFSRQRAFLISKLFL